MSAFDALRTSRHRILNPSRQTAQASLRRDGPRLRTLRTFQELQCAICMRFPPGSASPLTYALSGAVTTTESVPSAALSRSRNYSGGTCIVAVSGTTIGAGPGAGAEAGAATCGWGLGC